MWKFIAALILAGAAWGAGPAWSEGVAETVNVKVGEHFQITVNDRSAGTGYATVVKSMPPGVVLLSAEMKEPRAGADARPQVGAPAVKVFTFVATAPGEGELEINAARLWEKPVKWLHRPGQTPDGQFFYFIKAVE